MLRNASFQAAAKILTIAAGGRASKRARWSGLKLEGLFLVGQWWFACLAWPLPAALPSWATFHWLGELQGEIAMW
jgi:hypothetical protein